MTHLHEHRHIGYGHIYKWFFGKECWFWEDSSPKEFHYQLAQEMIDNTWGNDTTPQKCPRPSGTDSAGCNTYPHCTPTRLKKKRKDGACTNHSRQGKCKICGQNTMYTCSKCSNLDEDNPKKQLWLCRPATGRTCLSEHIKMKHQNND